MGGGRGARSASFWLLMSVKDGRRSAANTHYSYNITSAELNLNTRRFEIFTESFSRRIILFLYLCVLNIDNWPRKCKNILILHWSSFVSEPECSMCGQKIPSQWYFLSSCSRKIFSTPTLPSISIAYVH